MCVITNVRIETLLNDCHILPFHFNVSGASDVQFISEHPPSEHMRVRRNVPGLVSRFEFGEGSVVERGFRNGRRMGRGSVVQSARKPTVIRSARRPMIPKNHTATCRPISTKQSVQYHNRSDCESQSVLCRQQIHVTRRCCGQLVSSRAVVLLGAIQHLR